MKHWQLFLLLIAPSIIGDGFVTGASINFTLADIGFLITTLLTMAVFLGWFYAMGTNLHRKLPDTVKMNLTRFKIFLLIPSIYILLLSIFLRPYFQTTDDSANDGAMALLVPVHLFAMFCIFYCMYFNAKALKAVEWQRNVTFSDFAGEFFLIWFFPIGIWIIQPRLNKIAEESEVKDENDINVTSI
jgi:hypothetical protein